MNLKNLMSLASQFGLGNDKINKVMELSNNYPKDINGIRKLINENGGRSFLDKALKTAQNPLVKPILKKLGVTEELINGITSELNTTCNNNNANGTDDIFERLKKLK